MTDEIGNMQMNIRLIMRDKGISVSQLAQKIGISQPAMSQNLSKKNIMLSSVIAIAEALEVKVADLFAIPAGYQHYSIRNSNPKKGGVVEEEAQKQTLNEEVMQNDAETSELAGMRAMFCPKCGTKFFVEGVH